MMSLDFKIWQLLSSWFKTWIVAKWMTIQTKKEFLWWKPVTLMSAYGKFNICSPLIFIPHLLTISKNTIKRYARKFEINANIRGIRKSGCYERANNDCHFLSSISFTKCTSALKNEPIIQNTQHWAPKKTQH